MTQAANAVSAREDRRGGLDAPAKRRAAILIVDDEPGIRNFLQRALAKEYGLVEVVDTAEAAEELRHRCCFDVLIVDISLPGRSGLDWIQDLRGAGDGADVIFITAYADLNATIGALRAGAADFILKPFRIEQLAASIECCLARRRAARPPAALPREAEALGERRYGERELIGGCAAMQELSRVIERVAPTPTSVLIEGETGTGKELAAAAIHRASRRRGLFVAVNCVAIAPELFESELFGHTKGAFTGAHQAREGLFSAARGGTLFLDEISEMPLPFQAKLLRAFESRRIRPVGADHELPVDVRLVIATNRDLAAAVRGGGFREDLYYRLNVMKLRLPALRERAGDIPELLEFFSRALAPELGVARYVFRAEEIERLQAYPWPGNVRELKNVVERTLLLGHPPWETIGAAPDMAVAPEAGATGFPADWTLAQIEKQHTLRVLGAARGNKSEAARRLGISRKTLERKLVP